MDRHGMPEGEMVLVFPCSNDLLQLPLYYKDIQLKEISKRVYLSPEGAERKDSKSQQKRGKAQSRYRFFETTANGRLQSDVKPGLRSFALKLYCFSPAFPGSGILRKAIGIRSLEGNK